MTDDITSLEHYKEFGYRMMAGSTKSYVVKRDLFERLLSDRTGTFKTDGEEPFEQWATRQVEKIAARIHELEAANRKGHGEIVDMARGLDAVSEELADTDKAVSTHNDRLNAFVSTLDEIGNRVRRLESAKLVDKHNVLVGRVRKLESQTEFEDDARLKVHNRRLSSLESIVATALAQIQSLFEAIGIDPDDEEEPMSVLETIHEHHGQLRAERRRVDDLEAAMMAYGIPVRTKTPIVDDPLYGPPVMAMEGPDRNDFNRGVRTVLRDAADRLERWMAPTFSKAMTDAAVRVVRGEVVDPLGRAADLG